MGGGFGGGSLSQAQAQAQAQSQSFGKWLAGVTHVGMTCPGWPAMQTAGCPVLSPAADLSAAPACLARPLTSTAAVPAPPSRSRQEVVAMVATGLTTAAGAAGPGVAS